MSYYTAKVQLTQLIDTSKGTKEKSATEIYLVENDLLPEFKS